MIYIETIAYNATKTLRRTIESVLNQTHHDFVYYLCENGSIDNGATRKIVEEYAKLDNRIVPFFNEKNHVWDKNMDVISLPHKIEADDFYCLLDADDEYKLTFFEDMLNFINKYDLDIAACGSDFINVADNKLLRQRSLPENLILKGNDFQKYFALYYQFMRTIWGKLFKGKTLRNTIVGSDSPKVPRAYGNDTFFTTCAFYDASRVGILAGTLHKYYLSNSSASYNFNPERMNCDIILHEKISDYLKDKSGFISPDNQHFLYGVYYHAIKDTLNVILNAQILPLDKLKAIKAVFICRYTKELFIEAEFGYKLKKDCWEIIKWIFVQNICRRPEGADIVSQILAVIYEDELEGINRDYLIDIILILPDIVEQMLKKNYEWILERLHKWSRRHNADVPSLTKLEIEAFQRLKKPQDEFFILLTNIKKNRPQSSEELDINAMICNQIKKHPMLRKLSANLACLFANTIRWIMKNDYVRAMESFVFAKNIEISEADTEQYLMFGQNLSAATENIDTYIFFKKTWISYLIDCIRIEEAGRELEDFEEIMQNDKAFIELKKRWGIARSSTP